jgi:predicted nuclease of predicted toxin-antitoxin system
MDHHVPSAITDGLRSRGVDVLTADDDGNSQLDDASLLARASELGRVLFSRDRDLLEITDNWLREGRNFSGLVYAHQLHVLIGQAVKDLELIAKVADPKDMENRVLRLPL